MAITETPAPTIAQLRSARISQVGCGTAIMYEARRRLRQSLPSWIEELNAENNWDGRHSGLAAVKEEDIRLLPAFFDDNCKNTVLIAFSDDGTTLANGVLQQLGELVIFSVEDVFYNDEQVLRSRDRVEAAATVLGHYLNGSVNDKGVKVWKQMQYTGSGHLPPEIANGFAGAMARFQTIQTPYANGLAPLEI